MAAPAARTRPATRPSGPPAAAQAPKKAMTRQMMRTPTPSAALRAMSPGSPLGPCPETAHHASTPAATRTATGMRSPATISPPPSRKGQATTQADHHGGDQKATVTPRAGRPRRLSGLRLAGDEQQRGQVEENAGAANEGEPDHADPEEQRVDVEVAAEARADASDHTFGPRAEKAARAGAGGAVAARRATAAGRAARRPRRCPRRAATSPRRRAPGDRGRPREPAPAGAARPACRARFPACRPCSSRSSDGSRVLAIESAAEAEACQLGMVPRGDP